MTIVIRPVPLIFLLLAILVWLSKPAVAKPSGLTQLKAESQLVNDFVDNLKEGIADRYGKAESIDRYDKMPDFLTRS